ncbi:glycosyl hydrolase family 18 protein [Clostridium sp. DMHC 10]|uniref:glycosyl hydrolase family 18 protein n=1 Tax=Clostridium sp. DMHC 10 TaxID=747377 RepID=UPI000AC3C6E4|nr:glycosyl hydrolase family 18 protein [Clostridium sp. DMHC 10]
MATALAPKTYDVTTGAWHGAHDYRAHGEIVDFVIIMTYEWGWSGGPPMAVAPINEVRKVINYAVSVIPPKKIMMGMPLYGYDWTLPYMPGGEFAESIGNQEAILRAGRYGAQIKYDEKSQSPYYNYTDRAGRQHVVWFEDARSVEEKYKLVSEYGLRGVSYWVLAQPFPQNFKVLDNMFNIEKVIK